MNKKFLIILSIFAIAVTGYFVYRHFFPSIVAEAIISESVPGYIPDKLKKRIQVMQSKANESAEDIVVEIKREQIPLEKILTLIDNTTEEDVYNFLDDLDRRKPKNANEVFTIAKSHFRGDFDIEVLRKPFNENVNLTMINKVIAHTNHSRKNGNLDIRTVKAVAKKLLIEKEKELRSPPPANN